jgi:HK97 family phage prohead protease
MSGFYNGLHGRPRFQKAIAAPAAPRLIYKSVDLATKEIDAPAGRVTAAVNTLEVMDLQKDVIHAGAWTPLINEMLTRKVAWPSVLLNHDWAQGVGTVRNAWEGEGSLFAELQFNLRTQKGRDAFEDVRAGVYKQYSVGFQVADDEYDSAGIHHVKRVGVWPELSVVLMGASPGTRTLETKGWTRRDRLEEAIAEAVREALSQPAAKTVEVTPPEHALRMLGDPLPNDVVRMNTRKGEIISRLTEEARRLYAQRTQQEIEDDNKAVAEQFRELREAEEAELRAFEEELKATSPEHVRAGLVKPK